MAGLQQVNVVDAQALQIAIHGRLDVRTRDARLPVRPEVLVPVPRHLRRRTDMTDPEVRLQTPTGLDTDCRSLPLAARSEHLCGYDDVVTFPRLQPGAYIPVCAPLRLCRQPRGTVRCAFLREFGLIPHGSDKRDKHSV